MTDSDQATRNAAEQTHWPKLLLGALVSLVLGLGTHVVIITFLHVPFPSDQPTTGVLLFCNRVLVVLAALLFYESSGLAERSLAAPWKVLVFFLLLTTITERLVRLPFMAGFISTAWIYSYLAAVPGLIPWLVLASLCVLVNKRFLRFGPKIIAAVACTAIIHLLVAPWATAGFQPVLAKFAYLNHADVYPFPYGWQVTTAAFSTYMEPVAACLVAAALTWPRLLGRPVWKVLAFTLLVTMLRGSILSPLAYASRYADHFWLALASDGQFTLETVVLGLLTGVTWMLARRDQPAGRNPRKSGLINGDRGNLTARWSGKKFTGEP